MGVLEGKIKEGNDDFGLKMRISNHPRTRCDNRPAWCPPRYSVQHAGLSHTPNG